MVGRSRPTALTLISSLVSGAGLTRASNTFGGVPDFQIFRRLLLGRPRRIVIRMITAIFYGCKWFSGRDVRILCIAYMCFCRGGQVNRDVYSNRFNRIVAMDYMSQGKYEAQQVYLQNVSTCKQKKKQNILGFWPEHGGNAHEYHFYLLLLLLGRRPTGATYYADADGNYKCEPEGGTETTVTDDVAPPTFYSRYD